MSDPNLLEAWEKGVSMLNALLSLADDDEKEAMLKEETNMWWSIAQSIAETKLLADKTGLSFPEATVIYKAETERDLRLRNRLVSRIFREFESGRLVVIGFEPPRQMVSAAIEIPTTYLRQKIDWKKSLVQYESLSFVDVRVVSRTRLLPKTPKATISNDVGRKSRKQMYFACFQELEGQRKFDPAKSVKHAFPEIRTWLTREFPGTYPTFETGSDKTIYRYFKAFQDHSNPKNKL